MASSQEMDEYAKPNAVNRKITTFLGDINHPKW